MPSQSHVDVLIIGAGPAGVMACNALAKNEINVRIIDQRYFLFIFNCTKLNSLLSLFRSTKVSAGQADGIQPRTIEVLQVCSLFDFPLPIRTDLSPELWISTTIIGRRESNAYGCNYFSDTLSNLVCWSFFSQAFYNPGPDGGINVGAPVLSLLLLTFRQLTNRVPDVTTSSARYPFEVFPDNLKTIPWTF